MEHSLTELQEALRFQLDLVRLLVVPHAPLAATVPEARELAELGDRIPVSEKRL